MESSRTLRKMESLKKFSGSLLKAVDVVADKSFSPVSPIVSLLGLLDDFRFISMCEVWYEPLLYVLYGESSNTILVVSTMNVSAPHPR